MLKRLKGLFGPSNDLSHKRIYLDYASVTPQDPRVIEYVAKISSQYFANPSSLHADGVQAEKHVEECRKKIATILDGHADEIIFTSGGTESDNLAIKGVIENLSNNFARTSGNLAKSAKSDGAVKDFENMQNTLPHIITSVIEHPAILELLRELEKEERCIVTYIPVTSDGIVDLKELKKSLKKETVLITVQYVNNEIGTIQPISEIAKLIRHHRKEHRIATPYFHTDACQAPLYCSLRVPSLGIDMLTLDGGKIYGPRGIGILYTRRGLKLTPQIIGGSQEHEMRAGTENVPAISGFTYALELAHKEFVTGTESQRVGRLREEMIKEIEKINQNCPRAKHSSSKKITFNGSFDPKKRVPNNLNICVSGMDAEFAVLWLDARGISLSSVTSCRSKNEDSFSYVVQALDNSNHNMTQTSLYMSENPAETAKSATKNLVVSTDCSKSSLRITLGRFTTERQVKQATEILISYLTRML